MGRSERKWLFLRIAALIAKNRLTTNNVILVAFNTAGCLEIFFVTKEKPRIYSNGNYRGVAVAVGAMVVHRHRRVMRLSTDG
jgi:hypothetical protein